MYWSLKPEAEFGPRRQGEARGKVGPGDVAEDGVGSAPGIRDVDPGSVDLDPSLAVDEVAVKARDNGKGPRHVIWFAAKR